MRKRGMGSLGMLTAGFGTGGLAHFFSGWRSNWGGVICLCIHRSIASGWRSDRDHLIHNTGGGGDRPFAVVVAYRCRSNRRQQEHAASSKRRPKTVRDLIGVWGWFTHASVSWGRLADTSRPIALVAWVGWMRPLQSIDTGGWAGSPDLFIDSIHTYPAIHIHRYGTPHPTTVAAAAAETRRDGGLAALAERLLCLSLQPPPSAAAAGIWRLCVYVYAYV